MGPKMGSWRLAFASLMVMLFSWRLGQCSTPPTAFSKCQIIAEGSKRSIDMRDNSGPSIHISLYCNGELLYDSTNLQANLETTYIKGTPFVFFNKMDMFSSIVMIANYSGEDYFELHDSVFTDIPSLGQGDTLAPLSIINSKVKLVNCSFVDNEQFLAGGLYVGAVPPTQQSSDVQSEMVVDIVDSSFQRNLGMQAGAIYFESGTDLKISSSQFDGNEGYSIVSENDGAVTVEKSKFRGQNDGRFIKNGVEYGAIKGTGFGNLTIVSSSFQQHSSMDGAAVNWIGNKGGQFGHVSIFDSVFIENSAFSSGGAIYVSDNLVMTIEKTHFEKNDGYLSGGAVSMSGSCEVGISSCSFEGNHADFGGGAIFAGNEKMYLYGKGFSGVLQLNGTVFKLNAADYGGGVQMHGGGLEIQDAFFVENSAVSGGAGLWLKDVDSVAIGGTKITNNRLDGTGWGGGVYIEDAKTVEFVTCDFTDNEAHTPNCEGSLGVGGGGALYVSGSHATDSSLTITNSTFTRNTGQSGGAVFVDNVDSVAIIASTMKYSLADLGGALKLGHVNGIRIEGTSFFGNKACGWDGGSIDVEHGDEMLVKDCSFHNSSAPGGHAGAMKLLLVTSVNVLNSRFIQNSAGDRAGALYVKGSSVVSMSDSDFSKNSAETGGSVAISATTQVAISGCNLAENLAEIEGGSLALSHVDKLTIVNSVFSHSGTKGEGDATETQGGGAISGMYLKDLSVDSTTFENHRATHGGAILVLGCDNAQLFNCDVRQNSASGNGGAVWLEAVKVDLKDTKFDSNEATGNGGFMYGRLGETLALEATTITGNRAGGAGGGAWLEAGHDVNKWVDVTLASCVVENNSASMAGALHMSAIHEVGFESSSCTGNSAKGDAGCVFAETVATFSAVKSTFSNNKALGQGGSIKLANVSSATLAQASFSKSIAAGNGGALHMSTLEEIELNDVRFSGCASEAAGGALYVNDAGMITLKHTQVTGNSAYEGGGAFIGHFTQMDISEWQVAGNSAHSGGGLHIASMKDDSLLAGRSAVSIGQSEFVNNSAESVGGAMYFEGTGTVELSSISSIGNTADKDVKVTIPSVTLAASNSTKQKMASSGGFLYTTRVTNLTLSEVQLKQSSAEAGGALYMSHVDNLGLTDVDLVHSLAQENGGGIYLSDVGHVAGENVHFIGNKAGQVGAAVYAENSPSLEFSKCLFHKGSAQSGGGLWINGSANVVLESSSLKGNDAEAVGGALGCGGGAAIHIVDGTLASNTASESPQAIASCDCRVDVVNSKITIEENSEERDRKTADMGSLTSANAECTPLRLQNCTLTYQTTKTSNLNISMLVILIACFGVCLSAMAWSILWAKDPIAGERRKQRKQTNTVEGGVSKSVDTDSFAILDLKNKNKLDMMAPLLETGYDFDDLENGTLAVP